MKRGDVWWVNFDPAIGEEIKKKRPAVIISNPSAIQYLQRVQVIPLTTNTKKTYPGEAVVTLKGKQSKAMASQIMTVSKLRMVNYAGHISPSEMELIVHRIRIQLALI